MWGRRSVSRRSHRVIARGAAYVELALIVLAAGACASGTRAPHVPAESVMRYPDVLVLADSGEAEPLSRRFPVYPADERSSGIEAAVFAVFVVDSSGRAMHRTIALRGTFSRGFLESVCTFLDGAHFHPVVRGGTRMNALVVTSFTFGSSGGRWTGRPLDVRPLRAAIRTLGIDATLRDLEQWSHCG